MKFSIVSYLDDESSRTILKLQKSTSKLTDSTASLSGWKPHVTLGDGIEIPKLKLEETYGLFSQIAQNTQPLSVRIRNFGSTNSYVGGEGVNTSPYVLWANIIPNKLLLSLVSDLASQITNRCTLWYEMPRPYEPHATIAFRDLDKSGYVKGLKFLKSQSINISSTIDHIALVERTSTTDIERKRFMLK